MSNLPYKHERALLQSNEFYGDEGTAATYDKVLYFFNIR